MTQTHHIKRLEVDLKVPDQMLGQDLQQAVSNFCRSELLEQLQVIFDSIAPERYIRLDRLELNLPTFTSAAEFRAKLGERIQEALRVQLDEIRATTAFSLCSASGTVSTEGRQAPLSFGTPFHAADVFLHILNFGAAPWHAVNRAFDDIVLEVIELLQTEQTFRAQLAASLTGSHQARRRLILQTPATRRHRIISLVSGIDEQMIVDLERILTTFAGVVTRGVLPSSETDRLVAEIANRHILQSRTIDSTGLGSMLDEVMTGLVEVRGSGPRRFIDDLPLAGMELESSVRRRWRPVIRDRIASLTNRFRDPEDVEISPRSALRERDLSPKDRQRPASPEVRPADALLPDDRAAAGVRDEQIPAPPVIPEKDTIDPAAIAESTTDSRTPGELPSIPQKPKPRLPGEKHPAADRLQDKDTPLPARALKEEAPSEGQQEGIRGYLEVKDHKGVRPGFSGRVGIEPDDRHDAAESGPDPAAGIPWRTPYEVDEFHIANAGLVLVAPFFGMVFRDLGYLNPDREFVDTQAKIRAVHFSQFLVTSEQHPAECDLMLNKILCGMDVNDPIERFIDLTEPELDSAEEILDSALTHWKALKRTSAPVFQQTFLHHEGIMNEENGSWLLRIERTAVDVMLDTLPWTISIIKHPWMPQPVMVEW